MSEPTNSSSTASHAVPQALSLFEATPSSTAKNNSTRQAPEASVEEGKTKKQAKKKSPPAAKQPRQHAPMLQHYLEVKEKYREHILLFQVGDFYEVFFEDAVKASEILDIRLTSRDKDKENPVQMCGVPIHALDNYLPRLITAGQSCVVVSQVEGKSADPKKGVQREISRVITPGIRFDGDGLEEERYNYLAAAGLDLKGVGYLAYVDVSVGRVKVLECESSSDLLEAIRRVSPSELLVASSASASAFDTKFARSEDVRLAFEHLGIQPEERALSEYSLSDLQAELLPFQADAKESGLLEKLPKDVFLSAATARATIAALVSYIAEVSFGALPPLFTLEADESKASVTVDLTTRRNLELLETSISGERRNSLLGRIDYCKTAMGSRMLGEWLSSPSTSLDAIRSRHDAVEELLGGAELRGELRVSLAKVRDLDRLISRIVTARATPYDLGMLRDSLGDLPDIGAHLASYADSEDAESGCLLARLYSQFDDLEDLHQLLASALLEELPVRLSEGDIFAAGHDEEIDRLRSIRKGGSSWLKELEASERLKTQISTLKVKYNNAFGYFIEISKAQLSKVPEEYQRKQTLVNAERFVTDELKQREVEILSARTLQADRERFLFTELKRYIATQSARVQKVAHVLSVLDVVLSFAELAERHNYARPDMFDESITEIVGGRHPVIERVIGAHAFVPNDTLLDRKQNQFAVLTGPNMGGKSTYLRQIGLIQLLAQAGSFVPAKRASLGVVDRIFTRIGGADDLARGDSTFMVEMREVALIARKASARSLVLIDEVGRGTATADGLAIARALAEWLIESVGCRTVFATHFHELTELATAYENAFCLSVGVTERDGTLSFTHRIENHPANKSYGVEVARLAGLPESILNRAEDLVDVSVRKNAASRSGDDAAFNAELSRLRKELSNAKQEMLELERCREAIVTVELESTTPIAALGILEKLKRTI